MTISQLKRNIFNGKKPKFVYYAKAYAAMITPRCLLFPRISNLDKILQKRNDRKYILERVDYYCKDSLADGTDIKTWMENSVELRHQPQTSQKVYYFDAMETARHFPNHMRWKLISGDVDYVPQVPSIVKSRPLCDGNSRAVLLKLNKVRHFIFVNDTTPWRDKQDRAVFRGKVVYKDQRKVFMRRWFGTERVDAGATERGATEWARPKLTIREHLPFRYILAIEGNDVASNLKWIMSSNSIAIMPRPTCETWFMEGKLIPDYHYIEIKPDFSDLVERMDYFSSHPDEAEAIIRHAHEFVSQFLDSKRERLIQLLVLRKYFRLTQQIGK